MLFAAGAFAALLPVVFVLGSTVRMPVFAFVFAGAAVFAFASVGAAVLASAVFELADDVVSAGTSGLLDKTEMLPVNAGIARNNADSINVVAAIIVILDKTVAVPRGANAELDTLLVKSAPASVLPGWSNTDPTSTIQEIKNNAYKK